MSILVIEDDEITAKELASCITARGWESRCAADGRAGLQAALNGGVDAITLDRMLPEVDGLELIERLRSAGVETPVLMISALGDVDDRITGLRAGGDDYLIKPFDPGEVLARLEVLLRRHRQEGPATQVQVGQLRLDLVQHCAFRGRRRIELLPMEFKLLEFMMRNAGQALSRRMIFETVWEYYFDPGTNLIDVHVGRLRKKIDAPGEPPMIGTVRGFGYSINAAA